MPTLTYSYNPKPIEIICSFDPAIDFENSDVSKYQKTRDLQYLKFKPGSTPTKFFIRNIPKTVFSGLNSTASSAFLLGVSYFAWGVARIEDLKEIFLTEETEIQQNGLNIVEPTEVVTLEGGNQIKHWDMSNVANMFNQETINEISHVVLKKTQSMKSLKPDYKELQQSIEVIKRMTI